MTSTKKLLVMALLNVIIGVGGATLAASPRAIQAEDEIIACDQKKCDGVKDCAAGPSMQCFRNASETECLTRAC